mmetsp:Transcript_3434/g.2419  ORF Transcript_3434/g.2419 Transcript_3434/m.2419 type:complete len:224 (+) Transcript_3434:713-1384(+)
MLEKFEQRRFFGYSKFALSIQYAQTFKNLVGIFVPTESQPTTTIISFTQIEKLDNLLNEVKVKALECVNQIYRYVGELLSSNYKRNSPWIQIAPIMISATISTLLNVTNRSDFDVLVEQSEEISQIVVECTELLSILINDKTYYDTFAQYYKNLLIQVAMILLKTPPKEMEEMVSDPQAFVVLALDTCDKQSFKVLKTQGAKLLEAICDNIDGAVSFITFFCC